MDQLFSQTPLTIVLAGASGAIGQALMVQLLAKPNVRRVYALTRSRLVFEGAALDNRVVALRCDLTQSEDLAALGVVLKEAGVVVNLLLNATGLLHGNGVKPEKALSQLKRSALQASFEANAFAPILLLQTVLPFIDKQTPAWIVNLSARVGSIADNQLGGWFSYRAAKAAQNQLFKTASIELKRSHPLAICLQLHPGTVDSSLSQPFQQAVPKGKLFTAPQSAAYLLDVIGSKTVADTGSFWDWNNQPVPW
jgi:NAD(P)-dependent dehydrogenase (short-subunit alcohol dehydrogenase family)